MLTKDTVQLVQDTAVKAASSRIITAPSEPKHVYYVLDAAGEMQKLYADPEPALHRPTDFASVVELANDADAEQNQSLWVSLSGITAILSDDRRERAHLKLTLSQQFKTLSGWNDTGIGGACLDHIQAYTFFRTVFRDSLAAHSGIRDDVRKVDFAKAQQAAGEVSRTGVSMSRKLVAEASGADKLPEVLTFDVPVFAEAIAPVRVQVRVAFDLEPQLEKFRFIVLPCEIEAAIEKAESWLETQIHQQLEGTEGINVYRGTP
jgi:hypothetical protein